MKFELDTTTKTITLKEGTTVEELNEMVKEFNLEGYKIIPEVRMDWYPYYPTWPTCPTYSPPYIVHDMTTTEVVYDNYSETLTTLTDPFEFKQKDIEPMFPKITE